MKPLKPATPIYNEDTDKMRKNSPHYSEKELWMNDIYTVHVNRHQKTPIGMMTWLSIKRNDKQALPDWRHFQWIKNQLVGEENEGCELYPSESRIVDGANQYHIWVFEDPTIKFPFGFFEGRLVTRTSGVKGAVQREFPEDRLPKDIEEMEERARVGIDALKNPKP